MTIVHVNTMVIYRRDFISDEEYNEFIYALITNLKWGILRQEATPNRAQSYTIMCREERTVI